MYLPYFKQTSSKFVFTSRFKSGFCGLYAKGWFSFQIDLVWDVEAKRYNFVCLTSQWSGKSVSVQSRRRPWLAVSRGLKPWTLEPLHSAYVHSLRIVWKFWNRKFETLIVYCSCLANGNAIFISFRTIVGHFTQSVLCRINIMWAAVSENGPWGEHFQNRSLAQNSSLGLVADTQSEDIGEKQEFMP